MKKICKDYGLINSDFYMVDDMQGDEDKSYEEDDNDSLSDKLFAHDYNINNASAYIAVDFLKEKHHHLSEYCRIIYSPPDLA